MQGRPKGGKNKYYSKEEKIKIVQEILRGKTTKDITNEYGEKGLENQKKPGNPLCKYSNKKNLTDIEKLQYENMKLRIENERLKKGYLMKGDGSAVVFKK